MPDHDPPPQQPDGPPPSQNPPSQNQANPTKPGQPGPQEVAKREALAKADGHQAQRGPEAEARTRQQIELQQQADLIHSDEAVIPNFLVVFFVMFGLWGVWYFAFHLAPLEQPEPRSVLEARPTVVKSAQNIAADPANEAKLGTFSPTGEFSTFDLTPGTAQLQVGAALFQGRCAQCHGGDGQGRVGVLEAATLQGDSVVWTLPPDRLAELVRYGFAGLMPQWGNDQGVIALHSVATYLSQVMAPAPGTRSPISITSGGINAQQPINTFTRPWERADGEQIKAGQGGDK